MLILIVVGILIFILYQTLKGTGTANLAPVTPPGVSYATSISTQDNGLSPIDVGGLSLNIPNAVLQWRSLAEKYAQINSILDPEEILAIIWNESSGNPNAQNPGDPSWGLMGVTLRIGTVYGGVSTGEELFDPETNIKAGSGFLAYLKNRFGSSPNWSESYNEGETKFAENIHLNLGYAIAFNNHVNVLKGLG